jgi:hypothetical protein
MSDMQRSFVCCAGTENKRQAHEQCCDNGLSNQRYLLPILFIASNAGGEPRPMAEAT